MIPAGIVLLGDWRRPGCWAAAFLPSAIYAAGISALGGWRDMVIQLGARTDLVEPGILAYARLRETWVGVAAGAAAAGLAAARGPLSRAGVAVAGAVAFAGAAGLWGGSIQAGPGFLLWGSAVAIAVVLGLRRDPAARAAWLAAAAGWCVSVSFGYNTPALLAGALAAVPLSLALGSMEKTRPRAALVLGVSLAFLALAAMWHARPRHVYRDNPAITLDCDLGSVLPGGEGIRTNSNTAAFLRSLGQTVKRCGNRPYAVVPDCAAWWVRAPSPNPLPADWLSNTEISRPELFMRVVKSLDAGRNGRYVILQKWRADSIEWARRPMRGQADYAIADVVRRAMRKVGDAGEFEVFN